MVRRWWALLWHFTQLLTYLKWLGDALTCSLVESILYGSLGIRVSDNPAFFISATKVWIRIVIRPLKFIFATEIGFNLPKFYDSQSILVIDCTSMLVLEEVFKFCNFSRSQSGSLFFTDFNEFLAGQLALLVYNKWRLIQQVMKLTYVFSIHLAPYSGLLLIIGCLAGEEALNGVILRRRSWNASHTAFYFSTEVRLGSRFPLSAWISLFGREVCMIFNHSDCLLEKVVISFTGLSGRLSAHLSVLYSK